MAKHRGTTKSKRYEGVFDRLVKELEKEKPEMVDKLKKAYEEELSIDKQLTYWFDRKKQVSEDIEVMESMLMHQSNKLSRNKKWRDFNG